ENALLDERIGERIAPARNAVLDREGLDVDESAWIDRAAREFIRVEMVEMPVVLEAHFHLGDEQRTLDGRRAARNQKSMIATRIRAAHRPAGIAALDVRDEPF